MVSRCTIYQRMVHLETSVGTVKTVGAVERAPLRHISSLDGPIHSDVGTFKTVKTVGAVCKLRRRA